MNKGSLWQKWDFHLHSPYSVLNNQYGNPNDELVWDEYISKIEERSREDRIVAIAITDYFTIEGYKKVLDCQTTGRLENLLILPNIEFRVDKVIYRDREAKSPRRLNFHVLFSPSISPNEIEENFLHDLNFVYEQDPYDEEQKRKLKIRNLEAFGAQLKEQHPPFRDHSDLYVGCLNAIVSVEEIHDILLNRFRGQFLFVLDEQDLSLLDWDSQHHSVRKQLIQMSHAIFSSSPNTRDFCLGKKHNSPQAYIDEFKYFKPCIWGCDSHAFDERFLKPLDSEGGTRYCWIKADVTWEGLKQILFEPEDRVRVQENSPESSKSIYTLAQLSVHETKVNDSLRINSVDIDLNSNLIAVIGGRGSGKTALLDLIASCFREGEKLANIGPSFFYRLYSPKRTTGTSDNAPICVNLDFNSGEPFHKYIGQDCNVFEKADVIYLTQNHFDEYSANPQKLNEHIIDLVFEKYVDDRREYDALARSIGVKKRNIETINLEIAQLRSEANEKNGLIRDLRRKEGERADYDERVRRIEEEQGSTGGEVQKLTERISYLRRENLLIESIERRLQELESRLRDFEQFYHTQVVDLNVALLDIFGETYLGQFETDLATWNQIKSVIEINKSTLVERSIENVGEIEALDSQVDDLEGVNKIIAELRQNRDLVQEEIDAIYGRVEQIKGKERRISVLEASRQTLYSEMICQAVRSKTFLREMITKFEQGKSNILNNLKFEATVVVNEDSLVSVLNERIDNRTISQRVLQERLHPIFDTFRQITQKEIYTEEDERELQDALSNLITQLTELAQELYDHRKSSTVYCDFYNTMFGEVLGINMKIQFNEKALDELSMGERAIVLLKILLALDDCLLIIDQPEEHLDNRYIYTELKPAFRQAKTERQIIIATHNANLVVNTDAEQIIVAECVDGALSYTVGTLENPQMRDSITTILEGGEEAFMKREEKYGYKF